MSDSQRKEQEEKAEQDNREGQGTAHVVYDYDLPEFSKGHFDIKIDDIEVLRLSCQSVDIDKMPNGSLKLAVKFFASREMIEFYISLDMDKLRHIVLTQSADDGSWSYPVVDGIFVCCRATLHYSTATSVNDELVLGFVQYGSVQREKRLFHD